MSVEPFIRRKLSMIQDEVNEKICPYFQMHIRVIFYMLNQNPSVASAVVLGMSYPRVKHLLLAMLVISTSRSVRIFNCFAYKMNESYTAPLHPLGCIELIKCNGPSTIDTVPQIQLVRTLWQKLTIFSSTTCRTYKNYLNLQTLTSMSQRHQM